MNFYSKEKQDRFAYYLIGKKGTFLDIGCYNPVQWNNTKALEEIGWTGLLFDIKEEWISLVQQHRLNPGFCVDVTDKAFVDTLNENLSNKTIDYISLDVDDASISALNNVLESDIEFKCMTFEHCLFEEPKQKQNSKDILEARGYTVLFENVLCDLSHDGYEELQPFEDWWINTKYFNQNITELYAKDIFFEDCIQKLLRYKYDNK